MFSIKHFFCVFTIFMFLVFMNSLMFKDDRNSLVSSSTHACKKYPVTHHQLLHRLFFTRLKKNVSDFKSFISNLRFRKSKENRWLMFQSHSSTLGDADEAD